MPEILDRCVAHVMEQGHDEKSAFAICQASIGAAKPGATEADVLAAATLGAAVRKTARPFSSPLSLSRILQEHANGDVTVEHQIAYGGDFVHQEYGEFSLSPLKFKKWAANMERLAGMGQKIPVWIGHPRDVVSAPAAGWIQGLAVSGDVPIAQIRLLAATAERIRKGEFLYVSPEFLDHDHDEQGQDIGPALQGLGITNTPFLVGLPELRLSASQARIALSASPGVRMIRLAEHGGQTSDAHASRIALAPPVCEEVEMDKLLLLLGVKTAEEAEKKAAELTKLAAKVTESETKLAKLQDVEGQVVKLTKELETATAAVAEAKKAAESKEPEVGRLTKKLDDQNAEMIKLTATVASLNDSQLGRDVIAAVEDAVADGKLLPADIKGYERSDPAKALGWLKADAVYRGDLNALRVALARAPRKVNLATHLRDVSRDTAPEDDGSKKGQYLALAREIEAKEKVSTTTAMRLARERNQQLYTEYLEEDEHKRYGT